MQILEPGHFDEANRFVKTEATFSQANAKNTNSTDRSLSGPKSHEAEPRTIGREPHVCIEIKKNYHATLLSWSTWLTVWITRGAYVRPARNDHDIAQHGGHIKRYFFFLLRFLLRFHFSLKLEDAISSTNEAILPLLFKRAIIAPNTTNVSEGNNELLEENHMCA